MSGTGRSSPILSEINQRTLRRIRRAERGKNVIGEEESEEEFQEMEGDLNQLGEGANNNQQQRRVLASYTFANARHCGSSS